MAFQRGDIIEVPFQVPHSGRIEKHPAVIISNEEVYEQDECYICVMMTTSKRIDLFTFMIEDEMLVSPNNKDFAQARCHLVTNVMKSLVVNNSKRNRMKSDFVNKLVVQIQAVALSAN
jgi:mRNA-degrading endonuclease toxin of MazEF toxin-antitoxin module